MITFHIDQVSPKLRGYCGMMLDHLEKHCSKALLSPGYGNIKLNVLIDIHVKERLNDNCYSIKSFHKPEIEGSIAIHKLLSDIISSQFSEEINISYPALKFDYIINYSSLESAAPSEITSFVPSTPKYTFDQLILPSKVKSEIMEALCVIEYTDLIYNKWGYGAIEPHPRSILNFYGPPGTGKTMCAHAIAHKLKCPFLILNYADIESKYVGDAAKNMALAFSNAQKYGAIMFFDEADSFLGKRIENVSQGADQALNSLRSQTLMLLEDFSGIVIFATNLVKNFDHAFESRILKHIKFDLPNFQARKNIISSLIPSCLPVEAPISDKALSTLSTISDGMSGRELKNAVLETLIRKASTSGENALFTISDFIYAFKEKKKSLEQLKKEKEASTKEKIVKALSKANIQNTTTNKSAESHVTIQSKSKAERVGERRADRGGDVG